MPTKAPTPRQSEIVAIFREMKRATGAYPTVGEVAARLNPPLSRTCTYVHIRSMVDRGILKKTDDPSRCYELADEPRVLASAVVEAVNRVFAKKMAPTKTHQAILTEIAALPVA